MAEGRLTWRTISWLLPLIYRGDMSFHPWLVNLSKSYVSSKFTGSTCIVLPQVTGLLSVQ